MNNYEHELSQGESEGVEFKRSTSLLKEAVQTLCAFANHQGGVLYFGVADDGTVIGQSVTDFTQKNVANTINSIQNPNSIPKSRNSNSTRKLAYESVWSRALSNLMLLMEDHISG